MYLMTVSTLSYDEALRVVQHCREMANPNMGFRAQLMKYQEDKLLKVCDMIPPPCLPPLIKGWLLHLRSNDYNVIHNNIIVVTCFVCRSHVSRLFRP